MSPKSRANKSGVNFRILFLLFLDNNNLQYDTLHDFSVWGRTGSDPGFEAILEKNTILTL